MKFRLIIPILFSLISCGGGSGSDDSGSGQDQVDGGGSSNDDSGASDNPSGSSGGNNNNNDDSNTVETGLVTIAFTDAPIDTATAVNIKVTGMRAVNSNSSEQDAGSDILTFEPAIDVDLLSLYGSASQTLLDRFEIPTGVYDEFRLLLSANASDNNIVFNDGSQQTLEVGDASTSGLRIFGQFTVTTGEQNFTADFDLRRSITELPEGGYEFIPATRIVDGTTVGTISGTVDASACGSDVNNIEDNAAIYLYEGSNTSPIDYSDSTSPLTSVTLVAAAGADITYEVGFIPAGDYTITLVCNATTDNIQQADTLTYVGTSNISVTVNNNSQNDFSASEGDGGILDPILD